MKTTLLSLFAVTAILFASCERDNAMSNAPTELRVSSGVDVMAKAAAYTQENKIASGETVSLWVYDAFAPLYKANQLTADANSGFTGSTMYFPQSGNSIDLFAMHGNFTTPFASGDNYPNSAIGYSVAASQTTIGSEAYLKSDLLYTCSKGVTRGGNPTTVPLTFYHMLSKFEFAIIKGDGAPELTASTAVSLGNNIIINGTFTPPPRQLNFDLSDQANRATMLAAGATTATMQLGQVISPNLTAASIVYNEAILVPQDMSGKVLTFKLDNGQELKYTFPSIKFESGKKYTYHITLKLTGLEVTCSINSWTEGGSENGVAYAAKVGDYLYSDDSFSTNYNSSKTCVGIVFRTKTATQSGLVVSLDEGSGQWGKYGVNEKEEEVEDIDNKDDGSASTRNLIEKRKGDGTLATTYGAFNWIYQTKNEGNFDGQWYLPAKNELWALYEARSNVITSLTAAGGTTLSGWYWSSSEADSNDAFLVAFTNGIPAPTSKNLNARVLAVLAF